jgi:hypothetical protein
MKKIFTFSFLVLLIASSIYSQDLTPTVDRYNVMASIGVAYAAPMDVFRSKYYLTNEFKESYKMGLGGTIDAAYPFTKSIAGRVELSFYDFMYDRDAFGTRTGYSSTSVITGGDALVMALKLSFCAGIFKPSEKFGFYGILGVGGYFKSSSDLKVKNNVSKYESVFPGSSNLYMGLHAGARFAYKVSPKASIFLESGYEIFFPSESWGKATFQQTAEFVPIKIGVMIHTF